MTGVGTPDGARADPPPVTGGLARSGARGGAWLLGANALQLALAVGSTMVLARVLSPADFGLFAMAMTAFALVAPLRDFGLSSALVQRAVVLPAELRPLGRLNAAATLALGALVVGLGLVLARFYDEPLVATLAPWLALALVARGLANVTAGLLQRGMAWRTLAAANLVSYALGAAVGCAAALGGAGVGALVAQQLVWFAAQGALLSIGARRLVRRGAPLPVATPRNGTRGAAPAPIGHYLAYARPVSGARLASELVAQVDRLVLGRLADATALGLYQGALRWANLPLLQLMLPMKTVAVATLSRLAHEPERSRAAVRELFGLVLSLLVPLFVFLALAADPIVPLLLGDQWTAAVPLFGVLALAMLFEGVDRMANWLHLSLGHVGARLRWVAATSPVLALAMVAGGVLGAQGALAQAPIVGELGRAAGPASGAAGGVALGLLGARALLALPVLLWATRGTALGARDVLAPWARPLAATLGAAAAALSARGLPPRPAAGATPAALDALAGLLVTGAAFWGAYAALWLALPGGVARARRLGALVRGGASTPRAAPGA